MVVNFFASLFFLLSAFKCFLTVSETSESKLYTGYWSREDPQIAAAAGPKDGNYCLSWDSLSKESYFDGPWRFGRALGVMGTLVAFPVFLLSMYIIFYKVQTKVFSCMMYATIFMAIVSLLLLVGLSSDVCKNESCKLGPGGFIAMFDFFWWVAAAYVAHKLQALSQEPEYEYRPSLSKNKSLLALPSTQPNVEEDVEDVDNDDGSVTRVTTITTYKPRGGKKVDKIKRTIDKEEV
jgi:hypothetical protein